MVRLDDYDDLEILLDRGAELIQFYRNDPVIAAIDLLNVDLAPIQRIVLRDMWFKNFVITVASRGFGKSSSIDSLTYIENKGLVYLYEVLPKIPDYLRNGEDDIIKYDELIYTSVGFRPAKAVALEKGISGFKIITHYGFEHSGSKQHPLLVLNDRCEFEYKRLDELKVGDRVCIQRGQQVFGNYEMPLEDAYLIGLFIGDGCISDDYSSQSITTVDLEIIEFCKSYCEKHNIDYRIDEDYRSCQIVYKFYFKRFDYFFEKYRINRTLSYFKSVPLTVRQGVKEVQIAFLQGYFDADGGFENGGVTCSSVSYKLLKEIQLMLLNLGIVTRLRKKVTKSKFGVAYILSMFSYDALLFNCLVGFKLNRKKKALNGYFIDKKLNVNNDTIPYALQLCYDITKYYHNAYNTSKKPSFSISLSNKKELTYVRLYKFLKQCKFIEDSGFSLSSVSSILDKLVNIFYTHYFFDRVESIEEWRGNCYDFEMDMWNEELEPNYFANGFVNHNTFLLGVNALLHALLYPGYRIGLIAPSFRQCWYYGDEHFPTFWTSDGLKTGKEFFDGIVCGETKVQSLYHTNKVLNKWENIERDGLEIITEKGFIISGSLDHKILVLDKNGAFVYKELNEIDYDTNIIVLKGFECFGNNNMLPVLNLEEDWRIKKCKFPKELDEDLAYLFGLLVGDGCVSIGKRSHYRVIFVNNDVELVSSFKNLMKKYFDLEPSSEVYKNGSYHLEYYSKLVVEFFVVCGVTSTTALDKKIPFVIKRSNKNCFMAFIKGLMDTDGSCYVSYNADGKMSCEVSLSTSSEQLGREIQSVLLNIGVVSNFNLSTKSCKKLLLNRKIKSNCANAYKVRITGFYNLYLYNKEVSFKLSRKRNKLEKYLSANSRKHSEFLYGLRDVCSQVVEQLRLVIPRGCSDSKYLSVIKNRLNFNTTGTVSFNIVLSLVLLIYRYKLYTDESSRLVNISELDFITVKPIKFKTKKFKTFDIEVENEHCYYANGFINHNSKMIFSEIEKLYRRSSIVREAAEKKPVRGADICYLQFKGTDRSNGSYIEALPVGVDGAKIRGSRFYLIEVDELAQMPPEIIDLVVTPMAAVSLEPMQRVRELERQRELIELGLATEEDFIDNMANKMIMTSSGYFKFNHMWERMKSYWKAADEGEGDKYAVHQIPYQLLPDGFLDKENIKKAKRTMSTIEFMMEYEAAMVSDSSGFFKASLIEECSTKTGFTVLSRGHRESEYILGVDPNQAGRAAAGLVILEVGPPHRVIYVEGAHEKTTQANVLKIYELLKSFNIIGIFMDSMGGGKAWRDLLQEGYDNNIKILDVDDKYNTHLEGKRILHLINPTTQWISDANFNLLALLENKNLLFPELPLSADPKAESIYEEVKTLKSQLVNIIVTQTARGVAHFDTPKKDQNKDLYSALVLAAWGVKELSRKQQEPVKQLSNSGLIRPHQPGAKFTISSYKGNKFDGALLKKRN